MNKKISVIGGDLRQIYAAKNLKEQGYTVTLYGFDTPYLTGLSKSIHLADALSETDCVLLPLPVSRDEKLLSTPLWEQSLSLEEVFSSLPKKATVLCGMREKLPSCYQPQVIDYAEDEAFLLQNAYLTAEAALGIVISKIPIALRGARVLVTGYGRIGGFLATMLHSLGAKTYVASTKSHHLAAIKLAGCEEVSYDGLLDILPKIVIFRINY